MFGSREYPINRVAREAHLKYEQLYKRCVQYFINQRSAAPTVVPAASQPFSSRDISFTGDGWEHFDHLDPIVTDLEYYTAIEQLKSLAISDVGLGKLTREGVQALSAEKKASIVTQLQAQLIDGYKLIYRLGRYAVQRKNKEVSKELQNATDSFMKRVRTALKNKSRSDSSSLLFDPTNGMLPKWAFFEGTPGSALVEYPVTFIGEIRDHLATL